MNPISNVNPDIITNPGNTFEVYTPQHETLILRERNGADEGILSRIEDYEKNIAIAKFLSAVIVGPKKYTAEDIQNWPVRTRNYVMMKERMHEYGPIMEWEHTFKNKDEEKKVTFTEDLTRFDRDLKNPDAPLKPDAIIAYPKDKPNITGTLTSGKIYRMNYITGTAENLLGLDKPTGDININDRFTARNLEVQDKAGQWHRIENFQSFSGKDMRELRKIVEDNDPEFNLFVTVYHPVTGIGELTTLLRIVDFFFQ